jgi:hypothetical protein
MFTRACYWPCLEPDASCPYLALFFFLHRSSQGICPSWRPCVTFHNELVLYSEELAPFTTPKLQDHTFSVVCSYPPYLEPLPSIHKLRAHHVVVTGIHATWTVVYCTVLLYYTVLHCTTGTTCTPSSE